METRNQIPLPNSPLHAQNGNGANGDVPSERKLAILSMIGPLMPGLTPKTQPFESVDQGTEKFLCARIESQQRQRSELLSERQKEMNRLNRIPKWPKRDWITKTAIVLSLIGLIFLSLFSWLNGAQFVFMNFADSYWAGLLFCSVIPAIPFILKFVLRQLRSRWVELILAVLFLIGFFVFADQFARHFAKQEGLQIPTQPFDFGTGTPVSTVETPTNGPVSLRWFFFGQLILECVGSYVFFTWLIHLLAIRRNPRWLEVYCEIQTLSERVAQFDNALAELYRQLSELQDRKARFQNLTSAMNELFK